MTRRRREFLRAGFEVTVGSALATIAVADEGAGDAVATAVTTRATGTDASASAASDATVQPAGPSPGDWPLVRYDAGNTATNSDAKPVAPPLREGWRREPLFSPGDRLVVTSQGRGFLVNDLPDRSGSVLRARAAADGGLLWQFRPRAGDVDGTPAVAGDTVVVGGDALYGVEAADGRRRFRFDPGADRVGTPVVADGRVLVAADTRVYAVDPSSGREQWSSRLPGPARSPPAVGDGVAYVGADAGDEGTTVALAVDTGARQWRSAAVGGATVAAGDLVVATSGGDLVALSAADGRVQWRLAPPDGVVVTAPVVAGDRVFVLTGSVVVPEWDDGVHAYDLASGQRLWRRDVGVHPVFERASNTLAAGRGALYVGGVNGEVTALAPRSGRTRWRLGPGAPVVVSPVVADGVLYLVGHPNDAAGPETGLVRAVVGDLPTRLVVEGPPSGVARYRLSVTGRVVRTDDVGDAPLDKHATVDPEDVVDGGSVRGAVGDGGVDAYRLAGAIASGDVDPGATIYLDGRELPAFPPAELPRSFVVASEGHGVARYRVRVDGPLAATTEAASAPVDRRPTADPEDVVAHGLATGAVAGRGVDAYRFAGRLVGYDVRGPATVFVDGVEQ